MSGRRVLAIGDQLKLPVDAITEPMGMFANRGKGKSSAAHRLVEQLYHAGLPAVVLDVKGDWYGIRTSADGAGPGLPFLIAGGTHGDMPLTGDSGGLVARFLAEQRIPAVMDLSQFSKTVARRWVMEFAEELYRANTEPLLLVVDEADVLIPQRLSADQMRLLGAMEDIAKRGRQRGLGILVISQRIADVNKAVTDLLETLFIFMVSGTRTRKAILDWIDDHADPDEAKAVVATLSSLEPGECWVWSPAWLRILERFRWQRPDTYDSHATPKAGEARRTIKTMADVDLAAVQEQMGEVIERAHGDDPRVLRSRIVLLERSAAEVNQLRAHIGELEEELTELRGALAAAEDEVREAAATPVEVPVITAEMLLRIEELLQPAAGTLSEVQELMLKHRMAVEDGLYPPRIAQGSTRISQDSSRTAMIAPRITQDSARTAPAAIDVPVSRRPPADGDLKLGKGHRAILTVLAQHPAGRRRQQLTTITGYTYSGGFRNLLSALRGAGYIAGGNEDTMVITDDGRDALGDDWAALPAGRALLDHWLNDKSLGRGGKAVLSTLVDVYPDGLSGVDLAGRCGYEYSGGFRNILSRLRTLELIVGSNTGQMTAHPDFMDAVST